MTKDDDETLPVKRSKHFATKDASAPKAAKVTSASAVSKPKSPKPAAISNAKTSAKKAVQRPASKAKKTIVLDSDSDDGDDDFQASHTWGL